ncbi:hypothetical protein HPB50_003958 [Hyalomma asiaticum]|uniref:Uncharacterized protein n=1 Tax=Hyalomma asiaticum TaxID=266040 RepID=A0ACB7RI34_HYAAI|nr:hypothetical protein HPB50_003958 [Hyalomma asiaticum]
MGKAKKAKSGGKAKKGKPGSKGKKDKPGGKGNKGSKKSSPGRKSASASSSKEPSSSEQQTKSSELPSTSKTAGSSTPSQTEGSGTSSEVPFKPVNRQPLAHLILPSDLDLSLPRRPSTIYLWDWGNTWFFPVSVIALAVVVLGMVLMSLSIQSAELQDQSATAASNNATNITLVETTAASFEAVELTRRWVNATRRKKGEQSHVPSVTALLSSDDRVQPSTEGESTSSSKGVPVVTDAGSATEAVDEAKKARVASVKPGQESAATPVWLHAPIVQSRNANSNSSMLDTHTAVDDEERFPQNVSSVDGQRL